MTGRVMVVFGLGVLLGACGGKSEKTSEKTGIDGPVRVDFGDCAAESAYFVSGPEPAPFDIDDNDGRMRAATARWMSADQSAKPKRTAAAKPPGASDDDDTGSTNDRVTFEESKMGKKESMRQPGQYAMKKSTEDPALARKRALEEARTKGVLGVIRARRGGLASITGTGDLGSDLDGRFGKGKTKTGWGTIGTGRYGTISGSAFGTGRGSRGSRGPRIRYAVMSVTGDLDKAIIRRYLRRKRRYFINCYERELLVKPTLAGTVRLSFTISPTGKVLTATAKGLDRKVSACFAKVMKTVVFPKPRGGGTVNARYLIELTPGKPVKRSGPGADHADKRRPDVAAKTVHVPKPPPPYTPGRHNPMRTKRADIVACVQKHGYTKRPWGAIELALTHDQAGTVTESVASGVNTSKALTSCIATALRGASMKVASKKRRAYRCPMAFGDMPVGELPAVEITKQSISIGGRSLGETGVIERDTSATWKVDDLYQYLRNQRRLEQVRQPQGRVSIQGPMAVRAAHDIPVKVINRVVKTARATDTNVELAIERDGRWRLLRQVGKLPIVPVPMFAAASRSRTQESGDSHREPPPQIAVLVTTTGLWLGAAGANRHIEIKNDERLATVSEDAYNWKAFAAELAASRRIPTLKHTRFAEIAGDDRVLYSQLAKAIDRLNAAGFTDWVLVPPNELSVRPTK